MPVREAEKSDIPKWVLANMEEVELETPHQNESKVYEDEEKALVLLEV